METKLTGFSGKRQPRKNLFHAIYNANRVCRRFNFYLDGCN
jgi:hypothetical protein